jgi:hypothetical protein
VSAHISRTVSPGRPVGSRVRASLARVRSLRRETDCDPVQRRPTQQRRHAPRSKGHVRRPANGWHPAAVSHVPLFGHLAASGTHATGLVRGAFAVQREARVVEHERLPGDQRNVAGVVRVGDPHGAFKAHHRTPFAIADVGQLARFQVQRPNGKAGSDRDVPLHGAGASSHRSCAPPSDNGMLSRIQNRLKRMFSRVDERVTAPVLVGHLMPKWMLVDVSYCVGAAHASCACLLLYLASAAPTR